MASFSSIRINSFIPFVVGIVLAYLVVILVEGRRAVANRLSAEEELELKRQLNILNKSPVKTMQTHWGDIYDCVEFHKQPAFDHPMLKNHVIPKKDETSSTRSSMSQIEGCPKGTVPIRRTTREDLIRAQKNSSPSNSPGDEYRAGMTFNGRAVDKVFGARGVANIWNPKVNEFQSSGAEIALITGPVELANEIRFGWTVSPELYGDTVTRTYAYWTGDGGYKTGCHNTLCPGFVQVNPTYPFIMSFPNTSVVGGTQVRLQFGIEMERETGNWWLIVQIAGSNFKIGYWPKELFPLFGEGAEYIYWGGRVRSDLDGILPEMASGNFPDDFPYTDNITGYYEDLQFQDKYDTRWRYAYNYDYQDTVDCKGSYNSIWEYENIILHYGGPGGGTCA